MQHLDQKGLADRWLVSPRTLEQWRWQGKGPRYLKIGGRVVYRQQDIEEFEAANLHANTVGPIGNHPRKIARMRYLKPSPTGLSDVRLAAVWQLAAPRARSGMVAQNDAHDRPACALERRCS